MPNPMWGRRCEAGVHAACLTFDYLLPACCLTSFCLPGFLLSALLPSDCLTSFWLPDFLLCLLYILPAFLPSVFLPSVFLPTVFLPPVFLPPVYVACLPVACLPVAWLPFACLPIACLSSSVICLPTKSPFLSYCFMLTVLLFVNLNACLHAACLPHASHLPACMPVLSLCCLLTCCCIPVACLCFALAFFLCILLTVCLSPCHLSTYGTKASLTPSERNFCLQITPASLQYSTSRATIRPCK